MIRPNVDMMEALRLTRQGRLQEAMAVLHGASPGDAAAGAAKEKEQAATATVLDMVAPSRETGNAWTMPRTGTASDTGGWVERLRALNDELSGLADGRMKPSRVVVAPGARFETHAYANDAGSRSYKLYVPASWKGGPLPLVVMLHGCTQSPDDFAAGTRMNDCAEEHTFLVAYPAQPASANPSRCWNWFNGSEQQRGQGEPSLIAGIAQQIMTEFPVAPGRVYVAGLSAGGAAAATLGATYPDLFAAVGVHSGLACGAARDLPSAFAAMRQGGAGARPAGARAAIVPTIAFHGDADTTVNPVNGDQVIAQATPAAHLETSVSHGKADGGVSYTRTSKSDAAGRPMLEHWILHGVGHAWSGGSPAGSHTDARGPDASREMVRFFLQHATAT
ncbi:esterase [Reyranella soli]|uniref:Esterase n=2 Tax=Reyranella soli TaxID=1230389 RepID=A0A512N6M3_9HYPH|nr:esterase [Reyranella soli]